MPIYFCLTTILISYASSNTSAGRIVQSTVVACVLSLPTLQSPLSYCSVASAPLLSSHSHSANETISTALSRPQLLK